MSLSHQIWAYWASGGLLLLPLAAICFAILLLVFRTQLRARSLHREGKELQVWLEKHATHGDAATLLGCLPVNAFTSVFRAALVQIRDAAESPLDAMQAREGEALACLRHDILLLTALTAAAPLLGLLGTVGGMIATFDAVATVTGQTGTRVAGGISQALITTQFGLVIAMPGVFGLAHIRQVTRDLQFLLGNCRAHMVAMLGTMPQPAQEKAAT